jgi:hypothetical protein
MDLLPADHLVFLMLELPNELDFEAFLAPSSRHQDPKGEKGFDPRMMTVLLLYAYCFGIHEPGAERQSAPGPQPHQRVLPPQSESTGGIVCPGAAPLPESGNGEPGPCRP